MTKNDDRKQETALADAVAGVLGSLVALYSFYPLDVLKTNRQATTTATPTLWSSSSSFSTMSFSTFRDTYLRGLSSKTLHTIASSFAYFYFDSFLVSAWKSREKKNHSTTKMPTLTRLLLSAIAAMMNTCLTLPLDVLSAQQQTKTKQTLTNDDEREVVEEEEVLFFESSMDLSSSSSQNCEHESEMDSAQYYNDQNRNRNDKKVTDKEENQNDEKELPSSTTSATATSSLFSTLGYPILQVSLPRTISGIIEAPLFSTNEKSNVERNNNFWSLWKGLWPSLLLCSNPSIHYTVFDMLKARILQQKQQSQRNSNMKTPTTTLSSREAFLAGLIAKAVATIVTYPLIRAKVIMIVSSSSSSTQSRKQEKTGEQNKSNNNNHDVDDDDNGDNKNFDNVGMIQTLRDIYRQHGLQGLYRGCDLQLFHTVLKSALMMMVRERINVTTRRMVSSRHSTKATT